MTRTQITLNGDDWQFKAFYGEDWRWRDAHKPATPDTRHWHTGSVPGSVHHDLWQAGEIPNPYFERNSLLLEWIPARTWIYKKSFVVDSALRGKRLRLCFEGVDYEAEFFLNGDSLGRHIGMFTPALIDVSEIVQFGAENLLAVVIEPAPHEQPQVSRTSKVRTSKSRMNYWWDFCPRMVHLGIWDDVYLDVGEAVRIEDVFIRPQLSDDFRKANVIVAFELDAAVAGDIEIEINLRLGDEIAANQRGVLNLKQGKHKAYFDSNIENPRLWWPNGHGEQPLYEAEICVRSAGDKAAELDRHSVRFGIHKIELVQNEHSDPAALPYTLVVNGRKIYIKGWNWVPLDVLYGVPRPNKLDHLLSLAQRAHVNLLRVWGGGLIEKEAFYNRCDELGILVWQEFIQSSSGIDNHPSESPEFIDMLVREAEQIIPRKRNHPSLALWCGGNELQGGSEQPLDDTHPALAALKDVVAHLDPDRLWLPTSPTGRVFSNSLENIERDPTALHDVHGPWEYQGVAKQYELYNRGTSLLHSEFGVEGLTNRKSLDATIAAEHQWPVTLDDPIWQHLAAWWVKQPMWEATFGEICDIETLRRATQYMQAEGLRYALEADRRRKYHNSGTLPWQFNEPYPMAACTSAVDYYGEPKPAYYAVARAYEPLHLSASFPTLAWAGRDTFEAQIWAHNSAETPMQNLNLQMKIIGRDGHVYSVWTAHVSFPANSAVQLATVRWPVNELKEDVFFLAIRLLDSANTLLTRSRYAFTNGENLSSLLKTPITEINIRKVERGNEWTLTLENTGAQTAMFIWLEDSRSIGVTRTVYFSDNHFCLFPQETRTISVSWRNTIPAGRRLSLSGWNIEARQV